MSLESIHKALSEMEERAGSAFLSEEYRGEIAKHGLPKLIEALRVAVEELSEQADHGHFSARIPAEKILRQISSILSETPQ